MISSMPNDVQNSASQPELHLIGWKGGVTSRPASPGLRMGEIKAVLKRRSEIEARYPSSGLVVVFFPSFETT